MKGVSLNVEKPGQKTPESTYHAAIKSKLIIIIWPGLGFIPKLYTKSNDLIVATKFVYSDD